MPDPDPFAYLIQLQRQSGQGGFNTQMSGGAPTPTFNFTDPIAPYVPPSGTPPPPRSSVPEPPDAAFAARSSGGSSRADEPLTLSPAAIQEALRMGRISADDARARLVALGYSEDDANILLDLSYNQMSASAVQDAWRSGLIDEATARSRLASLGYRPEDVDLIIAQSIPQTQYSNEQSRVNRSSTGFGSTTVNSVSNVQRNLTSAENRVTNITGTTRLYIDVPTPQEFLDDFRNGFMAHINGMGLSVPEATWLMENMDLIFNEYLGELGDMAARGQQVFTTTPFSNKETYLGTRQGQKETTKTSSQFDRTTIGQESGTVHTQTQGTRRATGTNNVQTQETAYGQTPGYGPGMSQGQVSSEHEVYMDTTSMSEDERRTFLENFTNQEQGTVNERRNVDIKEEVYARPKIGVIHTLSPLDYLKKNYDEGSLRLLFEGRRGVRQANQRVGGNVSARMV